MRRLTTLYGGTTNVDDRTVDALEEDLEGALLRPDDDGYDDACELWNGMIDRRPGLIARCTGPEDVVRGVRFAAGEGVLLAIKGGGHNIAGNALCDGGLVLDLSELNAVTVDPSAETAIAAPGATLADFDAATQAHGLATPTGINSTTGLAGLTLGGGFGWLTRKHGLTVDNLRSVEIVTADGDRIRASEEENDDLFWGVRGGGGNLGVVTSFEYDLHAVGPEVHAGLVVYPHEEANDVLRAWRDFMEDAPEELSVWAVLRQAPPLPFLPEEWHGREVLVLALLYAGDPEEGAEAASPVESFGEPVGIHAGPTPYAEFQQAFDPVLEPGARNYWKSHDFAEFPDEALDALVEQASVVPTPHCEIFVAALGGAMARVPPEATAYAGRDARYIVNVHGRWESPRDDTDGIGWTRAAFDKMAPWSTGGVYVNFLTQEEAERVPAAYGENLERLARVKAKYDPGNLFRVNQNVRPAP